MTRARALFLMLVVAAFGGRAVRVAARDDAPRASDRTPAAIESGTVTLAPDLAARAGIATVVVEAATAAVGIEGFGRVLDPLPLVEALHARAAARDLLAQARAEHERVARLHRDDRNASTRDLESARAAWARAAADAANAAARVAVVWGTGVGDSDALADALAAGGVALARVDLPAGEHVAQPPLTITVAAIGRPERRLAARVLGAAPTTDPLLQGDAYLALIGDDPPAPGTSLIATVARDAEPRRGVAVPRAAILWAEGRPLAYVETGPGTFARRALTLAAPLADAWLVTDGIAAGERVVTAGAAQLLSSAMLGAQPGD